MGDVIRGMLSVPLGIIFMLGTPVTYIINIVATWQGNGPIWLKLLLSLTVDLFLASIWPITWFIYITGQYLLGIDTPIHSVLGL